ncbi:hypothetical protein [Caldicellulosiruptor bescii]|nr:hypothetical protein [Caldicellulosiruptor bescii]
MYFSSLGIGYMLIDIPLIQKFILYLGHPVLAFNYVLAGLLIGSGMPFPRGIKILSENKKKSKTIPVMWGLNGAMSVVGSVLSIMLSMEFGFTIAILVGALLYGLISLLSRNLVIAK